MTVRRIAVIGFGFSGLMVSANLVREAAAGTTIYIIAENLNPLGVAYGTVNPEHLLNVPANRMGAFPDAVEGFYQWLATPEAALAKQALGVTTDYAPTDFVPRALYGAYLQAIWQGAQGQAAERGISLKLVEAMATGVTQRDGLAVLTARGDAIAVDAVVLATGNEMKPVMAELPADAVVQDPWAPGAFDGAKDWPSPVLLMGVGLTAVDTVLSLRHAGYAGEIVAFSRHGMLPQAHAVPSSIFTFHKETLLAQVPLTRMLRFVRWAITLHQHWRPVIDALRPYTQTIWQRLTLREQQHFLARLLTLWNVHRHRMAPEINARIRKEVMAATLRIVASKRYDARMDGAQAVVTLYADGQAGEWRPSRIINCTGPQLAVTKSGATLLKHLLAEGMVEPHANGLGLAVDPQLRAWGVAYPQLHVIGALATGQLLESTAVPELRVQAAMVADALVNVA